MAHVLVDLVEQLSKAMPEFVLFGLVGLIVLFVVMPRRERFHEARLEKMRQEFYSTHRDHVQRMDTHFRRVENSLAEIKVMLYNSGHRTQPHPHRDEEDNGA